MSTTEPVCSCRPLGGQHVTGCPLRKPIVAPARSMLEEALEQQLERQAPLVLDVIQEHRRINNVRSCSGHGCDWHPVSPGRNGHPESMLRRHRQFNEHLANLIVRKIAGC